MHSRTGKAIGSGARRRRALDNRHDHGRAGLRRKPPRGSQAIRDRKAEIAGAAMVRPGLGLVRHSPDKHVGASAEHSLQASAWKGE